MLSFSFAGQLSDNTTLFSYKPGESTSTFSNASFVPIFLDEPINFTSNELRTRAELVCKGDMNCLFDIASTGDVSVGESTKEVSVQLESEAQALGKQNAVLSLTRDAIHYCQTYSGSNCSKER